MQSFQKVCAKVLPIKAEKAKVLSIRRKGWSQFILINPFIPMFYQNYAVASNDVPYAEIVLVVFP